MLLLAACKSPPPPKAANPAPVASPVPNRSLLLCRGGAPASVTSRFDVSGPARAQVNGSPSDYLAGLVTADLTIVKQAGSAGTNGETLDPGSCAYPTHSMYEGEPRVLRFYRHDTPAVIAWTTRDHATTAPVVRTFVDDFAADPKAIIRLQLQPGLDAPDIARILEWTRVAPE